MLQQQGLCGDGADATRAEEFGESDQQVDGEDDEFAHGAHRTMTTSVHKTAPHSRIPSYYEFATYRFSVPPAAPHGQSPKLGTLHPSLVRALEAAYRAAAK